MEQVKPKCKLIGLTDVRLVINVEKFKEAMKANPEDKQLQRIWAKYKSDDPTVVAKEE